MKPLSRTADKSSQYRMKVAQSMGSQRGPECEMRKLGAREEKRTDVVCLLKKGELGNFLYVSVELLVGVKESNTSLCTKRFIGMFYGLNVDFLCVLLSLRFDISMRTCRYCEGS